MTLNITTASSFLRLASRRYAVSTTASAQSRQVFRTFGSTTPASLSISEKEVQGLFRLWNDSLATLDATQVANRYAKNALLLPTVSDQPRNTHEEIADYFEAFLQKEPQGEILESFVQIGDCGTWAQDNGLYEFTLGVDGSKVKGRYTFTYKKEGDTGAHEDWKISHHHSSQMPEEIIPKGTSITAAETRALFDLWNAALASGDASQVAALYSKDAILLPTVSDKARTTPADIEDYFVQFLKSKPQGVIHDGVIVADTPNWAKDAGIYEFTMGVSGQKVKGRYSFVYIHEEGEWKIAHHHSSVMPEQLLADGAKLAQVTKLMAE
mmetsp:Transcript_21441/g.23828  ORF Transcript_21441/g.23828 Transcript_21441/m.23828 type:complete len:324 (-) Transcript_21441:156-1127(-)